MNTTAQQLSDYLKQHSGQTITVPKGLLYTLDSPFILDGIDGSIIDFRHCIMKLPPNCAFVPTWERYAVGIHNCNNLTIRNLVIDGNGANNAGNDCFGLHVANSKNITIENFTGHDVNHHAIWVDDKTPGLKFYNTVVYDNCGHERGADIYIENLDTDDVEFHGVTASRTLQIGNQVFYVNGYNSLIDGLEAIDIHGRVVDYRMGAHTLRNFTARRCANALVVNGKTVDLNAENITAVDCDTEDNLNEIIRFTACMRARLKNIFVHCAEDGWKYFGLRMTADNKGNINDVAIENMTIENPSYAAIYLTGSIDSPMVINGCALKPKATGYTVFVADTCSAHQYINGLTEIAPNAGRVDPLGLLVIAEVDNHDTA